MFKRNEDKKSAQAGLPITPIARTVPDVRATLLGIPSGETRRISCEGRTVAHFSSEASRLRDKERGKMFTVCSPDGGETVVVTRLY